ncbi:hypothetical protein ABKN59_004403 [Abortiporus biennis]
MLIHSSAWPPAFQFSGHQLTKKYIWVVSYSRLLEAGGFTRSQDFLIDQSPETTLIVTDLDHRFLRPFKENASRLPWMLEGSSFSRTAFN